MHPVRQPAEQQPAERQTGEEGANPGGDRVDIDADDVRQLPDPQDLVNQRDAARQDKEQRRPEDVKRCARHGLDR